MSGPLTELPLARRCLKVAAATREIELGRWEEEEIDDERADPKEEKNKGEVNSLARRGREWIDERGLQAKIRFS